MNRQQKGHWNRWGPFLSERAWGRPSWDLGFHCIGWCQLFNNDPHWRDLIPFHEYFHGDTGRGCGASHQTGWTGLIAEVLIGFCGGYKASNRTLASVVTDRVES